MCTNEVISNTANLETCKLVISIISIITTSVFSLITIIITCYNARKQVRESERVRKQQEEQYEKTISLQREQYEREIEYSKEMTRIQKRPYLVIDGKTNCSCYGNSDHHLVIYFRNKGNGSAFKINPMIETKASNGNVIGREDAIQDPIIMVNEICETKWRFNSDKRNFEFSINIEFEDMSAQMYQQTFVLTLDESLHIMVKNYAEPELIER